MRVNLERMAVKEGELIRSCVATIQGVLGNVAIADDGGGSDGRDKGRITIRGSWGTTTFAIEFQRRVTAENVRPLIARIKEDRIGRPLLMSEYIGAEVGRVLREQDVNFADAAGNLYLNAPGLFVSRQEFKRVLPAQRPTRLFQVAGLKILSVLLWEPEAANATYRDLAAKAGVSLGAIVPVMEDLAKDGFLREAKEGRQLVRPRELLDQWVLGYAGQLFPRLILKTCRLAGNQTIEDLRDALHSHRFMGEALLGGELAAGLATRYLKPARAALHLAPENLATWMGALRLIPDPEGNVDLLQRFGDANTWKEPPVELEGFQCANPILIYGELLRMGNDERLRETAELLLQKSIVPRFGEGT